MGEIVVLSDIRLERGAPRDGGRARIKGRRAACNLAEPFTADDLRMDHADVTDTAPCELCGQTDDCA